jgi:hypothetical protein
MDLRGLQNVSRRVRLGMLAPAALLLGAAGLTACRSAYVQADVINASGQPISVVEVDYPSASFGADTLAAGARYHYRFKILGSGPTKVSWTDASHKDHSIPGPALREGQSGNMQITITASNATWMTHLQP